MRKNYLIIGASSGIGNALAHSLIKDGHFVTGTFNQTLEYESNPELNMHQLDVTAESLDLSFIPDQLDGLVYCPGSINLKPFKRIKPADFLKDFNLQVLGAIKIIQATLPALQSETNASILLYSTVAVTQGFNFHSQVSTSKGAIEGLTKALSAELAPSIRVNCVAPSLTDTPLASKLLSSDEKKTAHAERHPLKSIGSADSLAKVSKFLLTDDSDWITGQVIHADGGMSIIR